MKRIRVTEDHIKLLKKMFVSWNDAEFGAPEIDPKRPYGNGDVFEDIAEILEWELPDEYEEREYEAFEKKARKIHEEMEHVLQISLLFVEEGLEIGVYEKEDDYDDHSWRYTGE